MATHSSSLAWEIPWTEELGRLRSIGSQRVRHNSTHAAAIFFQFTGNLNNSSSYATSLATTVLGFLLIPSSGVSESQSGAHCALGGGKEGNWSLIGGTELILPAWGWGVVRDRSPKKSPHSALESARPLLNWGWGGVIYMEKLV